MKIKILLLAASLLSFNAFSFDKKNKELKIGATVGDFADLVKEGLKPELEKKGYKVKLVEFTDYVTPNIALAQGSIDANIFQHKPYMDQFAKEKGLKISTLVQVPTGPLGLYAGKTKTLAGVKERATIAIPNDPTNLARALVLLRDLGWIELKANTNLFTAGLGDISKNTNNLKIIMLEAAQLPRALQDVDYGVVNGNYVISSGMDLTNSLFMEKSNAYINWIVVRDSDKRSLFAKDLETIMGSKVLQDYAKKKFKGYKYPASWKLK